MQPLRVAVVGAGMGGLAAGAALAKAGLSATVYEQASEFSRVGAGIHVAANAVKTLLGLGLRPELLAEKGYVNTVTTHRQFDSGEVTGRIEHGETSLREYGVPYTTWHRGDLHEALIGLVPATDIRRGHRVIGVDDGPRESVLTFADGSTVAADLVVAADGIHSALRSALFDVPPPRFTERVAYRAVVARDTVGEPGLDESCKWWGPDRHLVHYYVSGGREIAFTTSVPEPDWNVESWSATGDPDRLRAAFSEFHSYVRRILDCVNVVHRWAINTHHPLPTWRAGRVVLIGDASHTVTPYMGQGAALAMEDAVVLARVIASLHGDRDGVPGALERFEQLRKPRASKVQELSAANTWGRYGADAHWLYGYDAWTVPLQPEPAAQPEPVG